MNKLLLIFVFILFFTSPLFAQVDTAWVRRYNGPGNGDDEARAIAVDGYGNVYVTGWSVGSGTDYDYTTIKYYPNGDTAWVRRYNGPGNGYDEAQAIALDSYGNVYVTGWSYGGSETWADYATIKYYSNGDTAWVRRYNGPENDADEAQAIAVDGSDNVYVTGFSDGTDYATIKYYPNGDTAWVRRYNGPGNGGDGAQAIAVDGSDNVYVTGNSYGGITTTDDYATIKYYPTGDTAWVRRYNGPGNDWDLSRAIAVDGFGNVYVTGRSNSGAPPYYRYDCATLKYYPNGDTAWVRRYDGPGGSEDLGEAIAVDGSGNAYVAGYSGGDYVIIKYLSNGDTSWVGRYNGPGNGGDEAKAIAVDGYGNVYVTGVSDGSGTFCDYATIKYDPMGNQFWVARYNGTGDSYNLASAIAVDDSGNVYVTGSSAQNELSPYNYDYATVKYVNSTSSSLLPGWRYSIVTGSCMSGLVVSLLANHEDPGHWPNPELLWTTNCTWPFDTLCKGEGIIPNWADQLFLHVEEDCVPILVTWTIIAASRVNGIWKINNLGVWVGLHIANGQLELPFVSKGQSESLLGSSAFPNGDTLYSVVNLETWIANPHQNQSTYAIVDGTCPELPGFLFGTTPIVFDSLAGPDQNPFSTTPFAGTLNLKGETSVISDFVMLGDANGDKKLTVSDVIYIINYLFKGGPEPVPIQSADCNCDTKVSVSDVVYLINYLFKGGPAPSC